jgi:hypothetical protein
MVRLGIDCTVSNDAEEQKQLENGDVKIDHFTNKNDLSGESVGYGRRFVDNKIQIADSRLLAMVTGHDQK